MQIITRIIRARVSYEKVLDKCLTMTCWRLDKAYIGTIVTSCIVMEPKWSKELDKQVENNFLALEFVIKVGYEKLQPSSKYSVVSLS